MSFAKEVWTTLSKIDLSDKAKLKGKLTYLSWAWAWGELMKHYPESEYVFAEPVYLEDRTCEIWVRIVIRDGDKSLERDMWLPVMDFKGQSVINPTTRQISDTRMRVLVKAISMCGLANYIYAGEDLPEPPEYSASDYMTIINQARRSDNGKPILNQEEYNLVCEALSETISAITHGVANGDLTQVAEAWLELSDDEQMALWRAPTKGGCFTREEMDVLKSKELREAIQSGE